MINLLPYDTKQQIRAARTNVILLNYIVFLTLGVVFLAIACATVYLVLLNIQTVNDNTAKTSQSTNSRSVNNFESNLLIAKSILNQQISYSNIIIGIATALPTGTTLDSLSLTNNTFDSPTTLHLHTPSNDLTELEKNFKNNPTLFSNYNLKLIGQKDSSGYPVTINITISKGVAQ